MIPSKFISIGDYQLIAFPFNLFGIIFQREREYQGFIRRKCTATGTVMIMVYGIKFIGPDLELEAIEVFSVWLTAVKARLWVLRAMRTLNGNSGYICSGLARQSR